MANDVDKVLGTAITQIVTVNTGNNHIFQFECSNRLAQFARLIRVGWQRLAVADVAERTAAGADVAEDHEGGSAAPKAFTDVGAGGFFANRVQLAFAQHGLDLAKAPGAVAGFDAYPVRFFQRIVDRDDLDRDARSFEFAFLLDAFFSHVVYPVAAAGIG